MADYKTSTEYGTLRVRSVDQIFTMITQAAPTLLSLIETIVEPIKATTHEWLDFKKAAQQWTVGANSLAASTALVLASTVGIKVGDILGFKASTGASVTVKAKVTTVTNGTDLVISRLGTDATIPNGGTAFLVARPQAENSTEDLGTNDIPSPKVNYTQIFRRDFGLSETTLNVAMYGLATEAEKDAKTTTLIDFQLVNKLKEIMWELNYSVMQGYKEARVDGGARGTMGGLLGFAEAQASSQYDASAGAVSSVILNAGFEKALNNGGNPQGMRVMLMHPRQAKKISALNNSYVITREDTTLGTAVATFQTDLSATNGGAVTTIFIDRNFPEDKILIFNPDNVKIRNLRELKEEETTDNGKTDGRTWKIIGEKTLEVKNSADEMMVIYNLAL